MIRWAPQVFSIELRKILSYRVDFWVNFLIPIFGEMTIAYFLWSSIFTYLGKDRIGGFTLHGTMFYYLLVPLADRLIRGPEWRDFICKEIYDGSLTRYLLYPISFFGYKFVTRLAQAAIAIFQGGLVLAIFVGIFGVPSDIHLSVSGCVQGMVAALLGIAMYFVMAGSLELVAFWSDTVWSLLVMLRFGVGMLGGALIPLNFFPQWMETGLKGLPFYYLVAFPIRCWMGQMGWGEWALGLVIGSFWSLIFAWVCGRVWRAGSREFTGVGI